MKYPPQHHQEANFLNCVYLAQQFPLATMISFFKNTILSSHLPLVYKENEKLGVFIGHLDIYNPQLKALKNNQAVELIFNGPETYISPSIYQSTQLPTWNYFKSHFRGTPKLIENPEAIKKSLIEMTENLEGSEAKYQLDPDNSRMEAALSYIVGFEIEIESWEGKHKISQDKHKRDKTAAKEALFTKYPLEKNVIEQLYQKHTTKNIVPDQPENPNQ